MPEASVVAVVALVILSGAEARGGKGFPTVHGSLQPLNRGYWTFEAVWGNGGRRQGRGINATAQVDLEMVRRFNLSSKLESTSPACTPGTDENKALQGYIDDEMPGSQVRCCDDRGLFMPIIPYEYLWNADLRAFLYIVTLLWCFVGVSVLADAFMAGIEAITSSKTRKEKPRFTTDGEPVLGQDGAQIIDFVEEDFWNEKVACLTLFALGSSAPEILIACVGVLPDFKEDALGPGTIVGSATFNLYVIMGLCMLAVEPGDAVWAYVWLAIVLSDDVVKLWEAIVTVLFLPVLVLVVYAADNNFWMGSAKVANAVPDEEAGESVEGTAPVLPSDLSTEAASEGIPPPSTSIVMVAKVLNKGNYIQRRREAIKAATGNKTKVKEGVHTGGGETDLQTLEQARAEAIVKDVPVFLFDSFCYEFKQGFEVCEVHVERLGKTDCEAKVRLKTVDGNVKANTAYGVLSETITFAPGETMRSVGIPIKADYAWGKGAFFNVAIERVGEGVAELFEKQTRAKIMLSSEKHHKICNWIETRHQVVSGDSHATLFLSRGTHLNVATKVRIVTRDGSAKAGIHYRPLPKEQIEFAPGVTSKSIKVALIDWAAGEVKAVNFFVDVFEDEDETGNENGHEIQVDIAHKNALQREGSSHDDNGSEDTWAGQFVTALTVNDNNNDGIDFMDCILHYVAVGWKVLAAIIPPAKMHGGWPCFGVALVLIGLCSTLISDFASIFGCLVGLTDVVTSISIVALGTSLPDTFASMLAVKADETADNAVGNVTGSNAVNVFLGCGLPWVFSALKWMSTSEPPDFWMQMYGPDGSVEEWGGKGRVACDDVKKCKFMPKGYADWLEQGGPVPFVVQKGKLGPSLFMYVVLTLLAFTFMSCRRWILGAEMGGSRIQNYFSAAFMIMLWVIYLLLVSLQDYGYGTLDSLASII